MSAKKELKGTATIESGSKRITITLRKVIAALAVKDLPDVALEFTNAIRPEILAMNSALFVALQDPSVKVTWDPHKIWIASFQHGLFLEAYCEVRMDEVSLEALKLVNAAFKAEWRVK